MGSATIMWLVVALLFTSLTLKRILSCVAQGPLNVPLISALGEFLALNQSFCSLNLPQICLLVILQCQIEFSWTATLLWHKWWCDPITCVSSHHVVKNELLYCSPWTWRSKVVSIIQVNRSGWLYRRQYSWGALPVCCHFDPITLPLHNLRSSVLLTENLWARSAER